MHGYPNKKLILILFVFLLVASVSIWEHIPDELFTARPDESFIDNTPPVVILTPEPPPAEPQVPELPYDLIQELPPEPPPEPEPEPVYVFAPHPIEETDPSSQAFGFQYGISAYGSTVSEFSREESISFGIAEDYTNVEGITTFRGNNQRNSAAWGNVRINDATFTRVWTARTGSYGDWTGIGWNGQPAIVRWSKEMRDIMNLHPDKKEKEGLVEVIYGCLDGWVRFMDLDDGQPTRDPIKTGNPLKGSVTIDPRGYPLLYCGQGVPNDVAIGYSIYSLIDSQRLHFINGRDGFAHRVWPAFDSNPLINAEADTLVLAGENAILYTIKLNTDFDMQNGTISINPETVKYRYRSSIRSIQRTGFEASVAGYENYAYVVDNGGIFQCIDLSTMSPVWIRNVTDDSDSTPLIDIEESGRVYVYTACEVDIQGAGGSGYIRKLDAETGALMWENSYPCYFDEDVNGGVIASPVIGKGDIEGSVIFFVAKVRSNQGGGLLVSFDKKTGEVIWEKYFGFYGWSSPVAVYTQAGKSYLIVCEANGNMSLVEGTTGEVLTRMNLGGTTEGSPAVFGNKIVIGTRNNQIFCVEIG